MNASDVNPIILRVLPGGLLVVAATVLLRSPVLRDAMAALVPVLPLALYALGILLGWRLHRGRLVLALLVIALADQALLGFAAGHAAVQGPGRAVFVVVALLLPLNLATLAWKSERALLSRQGRRSLAIVGAQVLLVAALAHPALAPAATPLDRAFRDPALERVLAVPPLSALAFVAALGVVIAQLTRRGGAVESGLAWALVAAFLGFSAGGGGLDSAVYFLAAGLALIVSIIETSHGMAYGDELTGLPGRRALNESLAGLRGRYAVAMADIDHFKRFNDDHGHDAGDELLRMIGSTLSRVGGGGQAFRYGGEEFVLIFPGRSVDEVRPHLEELRRTIETSGFTLRAPERRRPAAGRGRRALPGRRTVSITISIGVAEPQNRRASPDAVVRAADQAMYRAKQAGRNRVSV